MRTSHELIPVVINKPIEDWLFGEPLYRGLWIGTPTECISYWQYGGIDEKSFRTPVVKTLNSSFVDVVSSFKPFILCAVERGNSTIRDGDLYLYRGKLFTAHSNFVELSLNPDVKKVIATSDWRGNVERLPEEVIKEFCKRDGDLKYIDVVKYWVEYGDKSIRKIYDKNSDGTLRILF